LEATFFSPLAAGDVKDIFALVLGSSFIAHVHSTAGAGLGQTLGYWTVPATGALFVTGGRFWPIILGFNGPGQDR